MPFKEPFDTYYATIIRPAIEVAGLEPVRADDIFRPTPIIGDIWSLIQRAKLLIADLTEKSANVFYELGLAHAIGKPCILISETMVDVPFDLQSLRVILYDKNVPNWGDRLSASITAYIEETVEEIASAVPITFRKPVKTQAPEAAELSGRVRLIEQQLASLRQSPSSLPSLGGTELPSSLSELQSSFRRAASRPDAARIARHALRVLHVPTPMLRRILRGIFDPEEVSKILLAAKHTP